MAKILESSSEIRDLLRRTKSIAVIGIKTEEKADQPSYAVPKYMQSAGYKIIPVPVYYPDATTILGEKVYRRLVDIPGDVDMVNMFRRPQDLASHLEDILAKKPKSVWLQLGIADDYFAAELVKAGIDVVQDHCIMVDHRMMGR